MASEFQQLHVVTAASAKSYYADLHSEVRSAVGYPPTVPGTGLSDWNGLTEFVVDAQDAVRMPPRVDTSAQRL